MTGKNLLVLIVSVFALAVLVSGSVSAFGEIVDVEIGGVHALGGTVNLANFAGDRVPILVVFNAGAGDPGEVLAEDVRIKAWISGESQHLAVSDRFDVLAGTTYTQVVYLDVPADLDDELDELRSLEIVVESRLDTADQVNIDFTVQRESYLLEILSVDMDSDVNLGESLVVDVVLKNRGRQFAEDAFLRIRIPELGLEEKTYFGDLAPTDQDDPDKEDAVERRTYVRIPSNAKPGLYDVEIEAFNADSFDIVERRILVGGGAEENTMVVTSSTSKTFSTGETETYRLTLVNRGNVVRVFELNVDAPERLDVELSEALVVVPAGSSRTVDIQVDSSVRDDYVFTVDVMSDDGALIDSETFSASVVEGSNEATANTTVLLTVILAIIFVVLLVVLIVLLTRKPETREEFGESYY